MRFSVTLKWRALSVDKIGVSSARFPMGDHSKRKVCKVDEGLPRPNQWVTVTTAVYRCMGYIDDEGTWRDVNRNAVIEGVEAWSTDAEDTATFRKTTESTKINFVNRNGQRVIGVTQLPGNDIHTRVYILRCCDCLNEYATNGAEVWEKNCPAC